MRVRFGDCVFDSETRELLRDGRAARISPKAFHLLEELLEKRPRALSKDEIHAALWPKTFVADTTLTSLVKELRAAIGDDAGDPRFIRTVPAFGYAFCGEAREVRRNSGSEGFCRLIGADFQVRLEEGDNILGRGPDSVLWVDDERVSRSHARIRVNGETATLEDLRSHNGTFVDDRRVGGPTALHDGDEIRMGKLRLTFRASGRAPSTRSASRPGKRR
jgi:DNA-binding winged helix-turn-helix (wHTH) protein